MHFLTVLKVTGPKLVSVANVKLAGPLGRISCPLPDSRPAFVAFHRPAPGEEQSQDSP